MHTNDQDESKAELDFLILQTLNDSAEFQKTQRILKDKKNQMDFKMATKKYISEILENINSKNPKLQKKEQLSQALQTYMKHSKFYYPYYSKCVEIGENETSMVSRTIFNDSCEKFLENHLLSLIFQAAIISRSSKDRFEKELNPLKVAGKAFLGTGGGLLVSSVIASTAAFGFGALTTAAIAMTSAATAVTATLGISGAGTILASLGTLAAGAVATGGIILAVAALVATATVIGIIAHRLYKSSNTCSYRKTAYAFMNFGEIREDAPSPTP